MNDPHSMQHTRGGATLVEQKKWQPTGLHIYRPISDIITSCSFVHGYVRAGYSTVPRYTLTKKGTWRHRSQPKNAIYRPPNPLAHSMASIKHSDESSIRSYSSARDFSRLTPSFPRRNGRTGSEKKIYYHDPSSLPYTFTFCLVQPLRAKTKLVL